MNPERARFLGIALVAGGLLAFLSTVPFFRMLPSLIWLLLLMLAGAVIWTARGLRLQQWQRLTLYALTGIYATASTGVFAGVAATGFIAMAFLLTYMMQPRHWWALIPGGVMSAVTAVTLLGRLFPGWQLAPLFMLLLAATFSVLYLLPRERGGQQWARYPAMATILITLIMNDPSGRTPSWLIPLLLIGSGAGILWWLRRKPGNR
ncbi:MAG TPA: hypothetical protein VK092_05185 [Deinococcales bacterium]|nr:hypothetical protein [Deinococcales bacterium]